MDAKTLKELLKQSPKGEHAHIIAQFAADLTDTEQREFFDTLPVRKCDHKWEPEEGLDHLELRCGKCKIMMPCNCKRCQKRKHEKEKV